MQLIPDSFIAPVRLWLLVGVAALAVLYGGMQLRRRTYAVRFTNLDLLDKVAPSRPGWRRHLPAAGFLLALAALVVGFARPSQDTEVPQEQATVIMALDTSLSMQANDVFPSRLDGAKEAATGFVQDLPESLNLGLVSFNGVATIRVQPSTNHQAAIAVIDSLELGPATAIGEAIFAALDAVELVQTDENGETPPARIVLMSDGETTVGRADQDAIEAAQQAGIAVSTIAFGTNDGVIEIPEQGIVPVPVNRDKLQVIADATGGQFFAASSTSELAAVYEDIGSQISFQTIKDEISPSYTALGLLLLTLSAAMSLLWFSRLP